MHVHHHQTDYPVIVIKKNTVIIPMKTFTSPYHTELMQTSDDNSSTSSEESDEKEYHNTESVRNMEPEKKNQRNLTIRYY